jgi:hypothetical protein
MLSNRDLFCAYYVRLETDEGEGWGIAHGGWGIGGARHPDASHQDAAWAQHGLHQPQVVARKPAAFHVHGGGEGRLKPVRLTEKPLPETIPYTAKKVSNFPSPAGMPDTRMPGRVWLVTYRLGTGKSQTFFTV